MAKKPNTTSKVTKTNNVSTELLPSARTTSKKARLIEMLHQNGGTTVTAISAALGWQPHTTRAAITGLRKAGHKVETAKPEDGGSGLIYRIARGSDADVTANSTAEASK